MSSPERTVSHHISHLLHRKRNVRHVYKNHIYKIWSSNSFRNTFKFFLEHSVWEAYEQLDVRLQFGTQLKKDLAIVTVIAVDSKQVVNIQPNRLHLILTIDRYPFFATTMQTQKNLSEQKCLSVEGRPPSCVYLYDLDLETMTLIHNCDTLSVYQKWSL